MSNNGPQIVKILDLLSEPIERHTIQFFSNSNPADPNHIPESLGSGVLISHGENHYIATAAHVLDRQKETHIGVYSRVKDFFELGTSCKCNNELIDIAIWYVEPQFAVGIAPEDWWYPIETSILNHQESEEERYLIYGFPAKKYEIDTATKDIRQYPFKYITKGFSSSPNAKRTNKNPRTNILLEFHKDKIIDIKTGRREHAPAPYGMSGCGLWYYDGYKYRLTGIMTEWKQPYEKIPALLATKIDFVLDAILYLEKHVLKPFS